jgi:ubiquinone/menaquinone biosynthesis C-methylase UbiE
LSSSEWADETARRWLASADQIEAMLAPVDDVLLPAAGLEPGMVVLDVGCGRGVTTRGAAAAVGPTGQVTGVDIADVVVTEAAVVPSAVGSAPIAWVTADAATYRFPAGHHHRVVSRFGVMFFDDPVAAFANLRRTTRPDGRLVVAVWQPRDTAEFQSLAIEVAIRVAADHGHRLRPDPPYAGPFAYGQADHITDLLDRAGWRDIAYTPHQLDLYVGGPGTTPAQAVAIGRAFGPLSALVDQVPPGLADRIVDGVTHALADRWDGTGVRLTAAIALVTASP